MLIEDETKPVKKSGPRKGKAEQEGKKAESRKRKTAPRQEPQTEQLLEAAETIDTPVTLTADTLTETLPSEDAPVVQVAPVETDQPEDLQLDQLPEAAELMSAAVASIGDISIETSPDEEVSVVPAVSTKVDPVSYQTIADAYHSYTKESLDRTQSFFGRLSGVRSLDKAFELQNEFARQAYDGFVVESRKIRELHSQLARQRLKQWEGFVARMISPR